MSVPLATGPFGNKLSECVEGGGVVEEYDGSCKEKKIHVKIVHFSITMMKLNF